MVNAIHYKRQSGFMNGLSNASLQGQSCDASIWRW